MGFKNCVQGNQLPFLRVDHEVLPVGAWLNRSSSFNKKRQQSLSKWILFIELLVRQTHVVHVILAEFLKKHAGLFKLNFVFQTLFKVTFFCETGAVVLLKLAKDIVNFSPGGSFWKPSNFNIRNQAAWWKINIDLQALITHDALLFTKKPVQEFGSKKEARLRCDLVDFRNNLEVKAVNCFDDEVSNLLIV